MVGMVPLGAINSLFRSMNLGSLIRTLFSFLIHSIEVSYTSLVFEVQLIMVFWLFLRYSDKFRPFPTFSNRIQGGSTDRVLTHSRWWYLFFLPEGWNCGWYQGTNFRVGGVIFWGNQKQFGTRVLIWSLFSIFSIRFCDILILWT